MSGCRMLCPLAIWCVFILGFRLYQAGDDGQPKHLTCYNDYIQEMNCTWDIDPGTNCSTDYSLQFQLVSLPSNFTEVTDINTLPGSTCQCRITAQSLVYAAKYDIKVLFKGTVALSKYINPSQTIKPLAPYKLNINTSRGKEPFLVWNDVYVDRFIDKDLEYQVTYKKKGGNWKTINTTNQKILHLQALLEPGYTYLMKVRSKPVLSYSGVWSDWSDKCSWSYESSDFISPTLIVLVCVFVLLPVALCFFCFKLVKKNWWENIPSPRKSALSKQIFNKSQNREFVFCESKIDIFKVEKVSCTNEPPWEKGRIEDADDPNAETGNFPALPFQCFPFLHFPSFNFPVVADSLSPFPLLFEDLALDEDRGFLPFTQEHMGTPGDASAGQGYSLFNSVAKDGRSMATVIGAREEEDGYHPFTVKDDRDSPLTLTTYSLSPGTGGKVAGQAVPFPGPSAEAGYQAFGTCVSATWPDTEGHSSEEMQTRLVSEGIESSDYMSSHILTFKSNWEAMPALQSDWARTGKARNTCLDFTLTAQLPGAGTDFPIDPIPMFHGSLQSLAFPLSAQGEPGCWQLPSNHGLTGPEVYPTDSALGSDPTPSGDPMPSDDLCLKLVPELVAPDEGDVVWVETGTLRNTVNKKQMKYIMVPENDELDVGRVTPYMKLSFLNVEAKGKKRGAEEIHTLTKWTQLKF